MTAAAHPAPYLARHSRPRPQKARPVKRSVSVVTAVWRHPRFVVAALFVVVAVAFAVLPSAGWVALTAAVAFVFGFGVGRARPEPLKAGEDR